MKTKRQKASPLTNKSSDAKRLRDFLGGVRRNNPLFPGWNNEDGVTALNEWRKIAKGVDVEIPA